jgi:hypothetical protein
VEELLGFAPKIGVLVYMNLASVELGRIACVLMVALLRITSIGYAVFLFTFISYTP